MKKVIILTVFILAIIINSNGQVAECVSCKGNIVDFIKIASAIGEKNTSTGQYSFAGGTRSSALGNYSFAFGNTANAIGLSSISLGAESQANGMYSVAIGRGSIANDGAAFALGYMNIAQVESSYLFGEFLKSTASGAFAIGMGAGSNYLINNKSSSLMIGFNSTYPTFFVNGSTGGIYSTGKVGIGNITTPTAKLHIKADNNEDASLKLEPTGTSYFAKILLGDDDHSISAKPNDNLNFSTPIGKNFVFENGKVITTGLQVSTNPGNGKLLQSDASGNAVWTDPAWTIGSGGMLYKTTTGNVGIGTNNPQKKLDVAGDIKFTGQLFYNSNTLGNWFATANNIYFNTGNVGLGTSNPLVTLEISKNVVSGGKVGFNIVNTGIFPYFIGINNDNYSSNAFVIANYNAMSNAPPYFIIKTSGETGIGTSETTGYKLAVAGKIHAHEVKVEHPDMWYDFVFDDDYGLQDIYELEKFVQQNKHLPDVPCEVDVKENGINLGEMNGILLKKVEELTLYIIQQQKEIDYLKSKIE